MFKLHFAETQEYQTLLRLSFFALLLFNGQGQVCQRFSQAVQL